MLLCCFYFACCCSITFNFNFHGTNNSCHLAAAMALKDIPELDAETIVRRAMKIAGDICVYTNHNLTLEVIDTTTTTNSSLPSNNNGTQTPTAL